MKLIVGALAAVSIAIAAPAAASAATCAAGQTRATISGKQMCIGAGTSCSLSNNGQYEKYHYLCEYVSGKYRLKRAPHEGGGYSYY